MPEDTAPMIVVQLQPVPTATDSSVLLPSNGTASEDTATMSVTQPQPPIVPDATEADPPPNGTRSMYMYLIGFTSMVSRLLSNFLGFVRQTIVSFSALMLPKVYRLLSKFPGFVRQTIVNFSLSSALAICTGFLCWLIYFRPFDIQPRVNSAVLITFDLAPTTAPEGNEILYDLSLNITFRNTPGMSTVHSDHLTTGLYYNGTKIGPTDDTLPSFELESKRRRIVQSVLQGRASNVSAAAVAEAFAREREQGQFNLNVRVRTTLSYWFFPHKATYYREYDCWLQFPPVPGDGTPAVTGGDFKCCVAK